MSQSITKDFHDISQSLIDKDYGIHIVFILLFSLLIPIVFIILSMYTNRLYEFGWTAFGSIALFGALIKLNFYPKIS